MNRCRGECSLKFLRLPDMTKRDEGVRYGRAIICSHNHWYRLIERKRPRRN